MAHQRTMSSAAADALKEPHSVSLKVLRLSRPSLAIQHPLPHPSTELASCISPAASLAYPSSDNDRATKSDPFILSPLLTLPPAFGNAYVGETFACTLCANNELLDGDGRRIHSVKIDAEMKTPTSTTPLVVAYTDTSKAAEEQEGEGRFLDAAVTREGDLEFGHSLQGIVDFHLKEEGNHVLAVMVSYTETGATSGKVRSFRKLYQFVARGCLVVRTKVGPLPDSTGKKKWALEAQLENCGEETIVLDTVTLESKPWCETTSLNWNMGPEEVQNPVLGPGEVQQVCFLVEQVGEAEIDPIGKLIIGMLSIGWRGEMGNRGSLSTGWLGTKPR